MPGRRPRRRGHFYDNAEGYEAGSPKNHGQGHRPQRMGRHSYVVSTKLFWGIHNEPNMKNTLNRKYLMQAIDGSLERSARFRRPAVLPPGRPDHTHRGDGMGMSDIISAGKALYWGTSEWTADEDQGRPGTSPNATTSQSR